MSNEIVEYEATEAAIAGIQCFKGLVVDVTTEKGLAEGKSAQKQAAEVRIALEKTRQKLKESVLERGRQIDSQAKPLFLRVAEIEDPIKAQIEAFTKREERERLEKAAAIAAQIADEEQARKDAEEARMAADRAELARQRAEIEAQQRAQQEADRKAREVIEAEQRAARLKIEEEERAARLLREEADRVARQAREAEEAAAKVLRDAEEARLKAERDRIDAEARALAEAKRKEQEAADAKARAEREAEEAKQRAILREQAELQDGMEMLKTFVARFGSRAEFSFVVVAINKYLKKS